MLIWLARLVNVVMLIWILAMLAIEGAPSGDKLALVIGLMLCLGINLLALFAANTANKLMDIWPFIFFRRMALQERKKIAEMEEVKTKSE